MKEDPLTTCRLPLIAVYRIIDANANRVREGLRVVEEVARFVFEDEKLVLTLKNLRHEVTELVNKVTSPTELSSYRESRKDVGKDLVVDNGWRKKDLLQIVEANMKRTQEGIRVLEEFCKVIDEGSSSKLRKMRFEAYSLEKEIRQKIAR
ncbi:MAG: thiamine-phosphate pyrophosphorylase [bacterium]|nr:thiamine-phosphate pyrophosphorylase [bacterium]